MRPCAQRRGFAMTDEQSVLRAVEADLAVLGEPLVSSGLALVVVDLASRLDSEPPHREAVLLSRELRLVMGELRAMAEGKETGVEQWLDGISNPTFRASGN